eukprot:Gb_27773 [translate_table: standard]
MTVPLKKKLLVLDVNGLLVETYFLAEKRPEERLPDGKVGRFYVYRRPFCDEFLQFCFENFTVGIWSSAQKHNVDNLVDFIFGDLKRKLVFSWHQIDCTDTGMRTPENTRKPLFLKELSKLWTKVKPGLPWEEGEYGPSNTLLIDDTPYKALRNPPHTAIFPYPYKVGNDPDDILGGPLRKYLEGISTAANVQHYVEHHPFGQSAISAKSPNWSFYSQVLVVEKPVQTHNRAEQLLTPATQTRMAIENLQGEPLLRDNLRESHLATSIRLDSVSGVRAEANGLAETVAASMAESNGARHAASSRECEVDNMLLENKEMVLPSDSDARHSEVDVHNHSLFSKKRERSRINHHDGHKRDLQAKHSRSSPCSEMNLLKKKKNADPGQVQSGEHTAKTVSKHHRSDSGSRKLDNDHHRGYRSKQVNTYRYSHCGPSSSWQNNGYGRIHTPDVPNRWIQEGKWGHHNVANPCLPMEAEQPGYYVDKSGAGGNIAIANFVPYNWEGYANQGFVRVPHTAERGLVEQSSSVGRNLLPNGLSHGQWHTSLSNVEYGAQVHNNHSSMLPYVSPGGLVDETSFARQSLCFNGVLHGQVMHTTLSSSQYQGSSQSFWPNVLSQEQMHTSYYSGQYQGHCHGQNYSHARMDRVPQTQLQFPSEDGYKRHNKNNGHSQDRHNHSSRKHRR